MIEFPRVAIACPSCAAELVPFEQIREDEHGGLVAIDVYRCPTDTCLRKAVVIFEPEGGLTAEQGSWVDREVRRLGAFFPQDYAGQRDVPGRRSR